MNNLGKKKKRRGGKSLSRTVMKWLRIAALVGPAAEAALNPRWPKAENKIHVIMYRYTGFDMDTGKWHPEALLQGWGPYLGAVLATYGIPKLAGIIRKI